MKVNITPRAFLYMYRTWSCPGCWLSLSQLPAEPQWATVCVSEPIKTVFVCCQHIRLNTKAWRCFLWGCMWQWCWEIMIVFGEGLLANVHLFCIFPWVSSFISFSLCNRINTKSPKIFKFVKFDTSASLLLIGSPSPPCESWFPCWLGYITTVQAVLSFPLASLFRCSLV